MKRMLDDDIVVVRRRDDPKQVGASLFWGDVVTVRGQQGGQSIVELARHRFNPLTNWQTGGRVLALDLPSGMSRAVAGWTM